MDGEHHSEHHQDHEEHHQHERKHHHSVGKWLKGFMYGAAAGMVASLLVAPQSGRQTRDLLRYKTVQLRQLAEQIAEEAREKAGALSEEAITQVRTMSQRSKEYVGEQRERVARVAQAAQETAKEAWKEGDPDYQKEQREIKMLTPRL